MSKRLEDYAMNGDGHTAAPVGYDGAVDWLCLPRFDSGACFASLVGAEENGHSTIAPQAPVLEVSRRHRRGTLRREGPGGPGPRRRVRQRLRRAARHLRPALRERPAHASLLLMPLVGFLPATDPRVAATIDAIADTLTQDGLILRYRTNGDTADGLDGDEGTFLLCTFWLVQALAQRGDRQRASVVFERALAVSNAVGLLAEEYDVKHQRMVGNFPQAFSHIGLLAAVRSLEPEHRGESA